MSEGLADLLHNISDYQRRLFNYSDLIDYPSLDMVEPPVKTALVWIYSLTAALSVAGNITVIAVLSLGKRSVSGQTHE